MKTMSFVLALLVAFSWSINAIADDPEPDGVFVINPVLARSCIAVKVSVSENQALAGIRWYNNDSQGAFAKLLVASGEDEVPPLYDDGLVVAENLQGSHLSWSEYQFSEPVGSLTDALYVIFQMPPFEACTREGEGPAIGFVEEQDAPCVFLSADGNIWAQLVMGCKLLVEPIYTEREATTIALAMSGSGGGSPSGPRLHTGLQSPYPNPCNPLTNISFTLAEPSNVDLRIVDLRGRVVRHLYEGPASRGEHVVQWLGTDDNGARAASGMYLVDMRTDDAKFSKQVVLLK